MDPVDQFLANAGILGPILLAVGWYVLKLHKELKDSRTGEAEVQEKRTNDAQGAVDRMLAVSERLNEISRDNQIAMVQNTQALVELRQTIVELRDEVRRRDP